MGGKNRRKKSIAITGSVSSLHSLTAEARSRRRRRSWRSCGGTRPPWPPKTGCSSTRGGGGVAGGGGAEDHAVGLGLPGRRRPDALRRWGLLRHQVVVRDKPGEQIVSPGRGKGHPILLLHRPDDSMRDHKRASLVREEGWSLGELWESRMGRGAVRRDMEGMRRAAGGGPVAEREGLLLTPTGWISSIGDFFFPSHHVCGRVCELVHK
uniref:Uncharacterized protein LOC105038068 isoform X1 n=1 Tax=Elaeis guineensis var. tenera TaxID=51953 RepID=A0A6I9QPW2_ELAGV|nr:uncharacterized protein LOC105038068 isoform X1 [Elaeis guineensis]